jgi:hypothetical protein
MAHDDSDHEYTNIGHRLQAGFPIATAGNLEIVRLDDGGAVSAAITVQRADIPSLVALLERQGHATGPGALPGAAAVVRELAPITEGWATVVAQFGQQVQRLEVRITEQYRDLCGRSNAATEKIGALQRELNAVKGDPSDATLDREAVLSLRADVAAKLHGEGGVFPQLGALAEVVGGLSQTVETVQGLLEQRAAPPAIPDNLATRDYVDQGLARLSGALREHVQSVMRRAIELAKPPPNMIRRVLDALRPPTTEPVIPRTAAQRRVERERAAALDPTTASLAGIAAAAAVVRGGVP